MAVPAAAPQPPPLPGLCRLCPEPPEQRSPQSPPLPGLSRLSPDPPSVQPWPLQRGARARGASPGRSPRQAPPPAEAVPPPRRPGPAVAAAVRAGAMAAAADAFLRARGRTLTAFRPGTGSAGRAAPLPAGPLPPGGRGVRREARASPAAREELLPGRGRRGAPGPEPSAGERGHGGHGGHRTAVAAPLPPLCRGAPGAVQVYPRAPVPLKISAVSSAGLVFKCLSALLNRISIAYELLVPARCCPVFLL